METLMVASSSQSVLRVCTQFGNTVTTLEGSSYLIILVEMIIIIIICHLHALDWLLWTGNKHIIIGGLIIDHLLCAITLLGHLLVS